MAVKLSNVTETNMLELLFGLAKRKIGRIKLLKRGRVLNNKNITSASQTNVHNLKCNSFILPKIAITLHFTDGYKVNNAQLDQFKVSQLSGTKYSKNNCSLATNMTKFDNAIRINRVTLRRRQEF